MKKLTFFIIIFFFTSLTYGQNNHQFFFNEYNVSINKTNQADDNTKDKIGFGIGMHPIIMADKKVNIKFGFEFNRTNQLKKDIYNGHNGYSTDVTFSINTFSIPAMARINFGKKIKIFFEAGGFADLNLNCSSSGTSHIYVNQNNNMVLETAKFNKNIGITGLNYGIGFGTGCRIPIAKYEMIFKIDYKHGIENLSDYMESLYNRYIRISIGIEI